MTRIHDKYWLMNKVGTLREETFPSLKKRKIFGINFREKSNIRYFARIIFCALLKRDKWKIQGEKIDVRLC